MFLDGTKACACHGLPQFNNKDYILLQMTWKVCLGIVQLYMCKIGKYNKDLTILSQKKQQATLVDSQNGNDW